MSDSNHPKVRACPVCEAQHCASFCRHDTVDFVRCRGCGSLFQREPPDWERIRRIYQEDYHLRRGHSENAAVEAAKFGTARAYLRRLESLRPPGRILLEVGCSSGSTLVAAAAGGWTPHGIELSEASAAIARSRPGVVAVHTGSVADSPYPPASFDAVILLDVIEHIEPPAPTIREIHRLLRPGGLLLLLTPNAVSLSARLMGPRWPHLFVEHVVVFSPPALKSLLERTGFCCERTGFAWKRINFDMLVRHAHLHPHILFGSILRGLGRLLPGAVLRTNFPFNIGEFYVIARRGE